MCRDEFRHYFGTANDDGVAKVADEPWVVLGRSAAEEKVKTEPNLMVWGGRNHHLLLDEFVLLDEFAVAKESEMSEMR